MVRLGILLGLLAHALASLSPVASQNDKSNANDMMLLAPRPIDDWALADFLLTASLDGSLQARDRESGTIRWQIDGSPLIGMEVLPSMVNDLDTVWITEPTTDGALLYFHPSTGVERIPASIRTLVEEAPYALLDNIVYTGSKQTTLYKIDPFSGRILHKYGSGMASGSPPDDYSNNGALLIGFNNYTLEIHEKDRQRAWTLHFGMWTPNARDSDLMRQYTKPLDSLYVSPISNNTIMAFELDSHRPQRWKAHSPGTLVKVFDILKPKSSSLQNLSPLAAIPQPPLELEADHKTENDLYIDVTENGNLYALSGSDFAILVRSNNSAWCSGADRSYRSRAELDKLIMGVHPKWCQKSRYAGPSLALPAQPKVLDHFSGRSLPSPNHDPPKRIDAGPRFMWGSFFVRVLENLLAVSVLVAILLFAVSRGWIRPRAALEKAISPEKISPKPLEQVTESRAEAEPLEITPPSSPRADLKDIEKVPSRSRQPSLSSINLEEPMTSSVEPAPVDSAVVTSASITLNEEPVPEVKRRKRGARGGKKNREAREAREAAAASNEEQNQQVQQVQVQQPPSAPPPIQVSTDVLGYGSHGTTVLRGTFENRDVAVKRMLLNFYDVANQEVAILSESDDHPNVIRYYCKYQTDQFLYIALELCPGTLEDLIRNKGDDLDAIRGKIDPLDALIQITSGLHHLHSLKIVHRDIKPQNILVASPRFVHVRGQPPQPGPARLLISDFGLCKKLEGDQSSFQATAAAAAGTAGWTAPEIAMGSRYTESACTDISSDVFIPEPSVNTRRLTRAVDIFSLGCVFYYVLSPGQHPFGDNYERQVNIENRNYNLSELDGLPYKEEARDIISRMIAFNPRNRPDSAEILSHPLFWKDQKKLDFLVKVSDQLEHETREEQSRIVDLLESRGRKVFENGWHERFPKLFLENLGKYRKYQSERLIDLLRALRNKLHHYNDFEPHLKKCVGAVPSGYLAFFTSRFPDLLMEVYRFAKEEFADEPDFVIYLH